jgi:hypothetical protein
VLFCLANTTGQWHRPCLGSLEVQCLCTTLQPPLRTLQLNRIYIAPHLLLCTTIGNSCWRLADLQGWVDV